MTDEKQGESTEEGESPEQGEKAAQERAELEAQVERLIEQLERLQESSRVWRMRLDGRQARIKAALDGLQPLKGKFSRFTPEKLSEALQTVEEATICYQGLVNEGPLAGWTSGAVGLALVAWVLALTGVLVFNYVFLRGDKTLYAVAYCICGGGLGGVAGALRDFIYYSGKRLYDPAWGRSYILRPVLGAIMGAVAYALLRAGLLVASQSETKAEASAAFVYFTIAFVGGFAVEQMARKLYDIAETTFAVSEKSRRK